MITSQKQLTELMMDHLSNIFKCSKEVLMNETYTQVFVEEKDNIEKPSFDIMTTGNTVVVKATADRLKYVQSKIHEQDRDSIFSFPFIRGHYHHYIPKIASIPDLPLIDGYSFQMVEGAFVRELLMIKGFDNALIYEDNNKRKTDIIFMMKYNDEIVGMASGSKVSEKIWQLGVDVIASHRNKGIASFLVCEITRELLSRGILPLYDVLSSNLNSHRVAVKCGYHIGWITDWKCYFDDEKLNKTIR